MFSASKSAAPSGKTYVEDVFSTYLYTGIGGTPPSSPGSSLTITNNIDLSTKGGMVWIKNRALAQHILVDTIRGGNMYLSSNNTDGQTNGGTGKPLSFTTSGFTLGTDTNNIYNGTGQNYASWTFRKQSKFFDVVTYTGDGTSGRSIAHSLGSTPGMLIIKATSTGETGSYAGSWFVEHRSATYNGLLNQTYDLFLNLGISFNSTTFTVNSLSSGYANTNGVSYVAYLFGHDSSADGLVQCGSYTGNGSSTGPTVTLGWEPQYLMIKNESGTGSWQIIDDMRGMSMTGNAELQANSPAAETATQYVAPTATGFSVVSTSSEVNSNASTYIYIAIRRGPMRVPTSGTSVFAPCAQTGEAAFNNSFPVDLVMERDRTSSAFGYTADRLRGGDPTLSTTSTAAEFSAGPAYFDSASGTFRATFVGGASPSVVYENFGRAPSFMDVVCYTGTGANATRAHNLSAVPQMMIVKKRSATSNWAVYHSALGAVGWILINSSAAASAGADFWQSTTPTAVNFYTGTNGNVGDSGQTYVAYLFATCPGVSKVGSYTGNGSSQTLNCGFTAGARFVLIKRTDSAGDWYIWDTARGIVAGNDPHLSLNTSAAEVTTDDSIDPDNTGFIVNQVAATNINVTSATYIYLAIA